MLKFIITYFGTGLSIAVLDGAYLSIASQRVYRPTLNYALADKPDLFSAVVFYLVYILGVVILAVMPNTRSGPGRTARTGALLGAMCYATYDLTNQATLKVWPVQITLIDIGWGMLLTATGAMAGWITWRWTVRALS